MAPNLNSSHYSKMRSTEKCATAVSIEICTFDRLQLLITCCIQFILLTRVIIVDDLGNGLAVSIPQEVAGSIPAFSTCRSFM